MIGEDECTVLECHPTKNGQNIFVEVEYFIQGKKRIRGWGFSLDCFDSGRFMNIISKRIEEEKEMSDCPLGIKDKADRFRGNKIDLKNKKIKHKDTGEEII
jgi:hypothetical protein